MALQKIFDQIEEHLETVLAQDTPRGILIWKEFLAIHPADIAQFLGNIDKEDVKKIFLKLPQDLKLEVFLHLSYSMRVFCLSFLDDEDRSFLLGSMPIDDLTDFFDELSDDELKNYLKLLHKRDREQVLSLMQFNPESAGGIMDSEVVTLMQDFTIERSIQILQRLQPKKELHEYIYVTNQDNELVGHIYIEDLVLKNPKSRITAMMKKNELVVNAIEHQDDVSYKMVHYNLMTVPVVDDENIFLGVISSETLVHVIEQEAASDMYRISALAPIKHTYFETPFFDLLFQRSFILIALFLLQIFSSMIIKYYEATLASFLYLFINTITSTGGNTSSQTSALVIQGIHSGEINEGNIGRFLRREFYMAGIIAILLSIVSFCRVYFTNPQHIMANLAISISVGIIILSAAMIGSFIPLMLKKLKLDPALSAGPFLATLMDILGLLIYCYVSQIILR
jgi:magnesium transporter